ncbi:protein TIFY 10b-like [Oryza brachyantha]|uniref:protein TIFY 10b-like n=1 Tax=Oryza brachyantha TaxID=4533 RepID=UPI0003EAD598|nr:protein TIFY 10b-like [Oryza brachyantha]
MAASARPGGGERATSFAMACSLLSRYVRQNGAAAAELGLGIRGEAEPQRAPATMSLLPGAEADEVAEKKKETMELFPQSTGFGQQDAAAAREQEQEPEQEKRQLTIFYGGKVLVFNDFPADKAKGLMQLASKGSPVAQNVTAPAPTTVTDNTKVHAPLSSLPAAQVEAQKPARANASDLPIARKASLHRFLEKRKDRLNAKTPYQASPSDATPVKKEPESQPWLGLGPNAAKAIERSQ